MAVKQKPASIDVEGDAYKDAEAAGRGMNADFIEKLADRIGRHSGANAVFGDPVAKGDITVIPVGQSIWGSGGGGAASDEFGDGAGGGGGAISRPIGYIELTQHSARFVPLQQPWQDLKVILGYAFAVWLVVRALRGILGR
jgi:uncharacterized spore protein YtfJ